MPFVPRGELEEREAQHAALAERLAQYDEMLPHLALAQELKEEIVRVLEENPQTPGREIGDLAFGLVLKREAQNARDEIAAEYEREHRRELYERVKDEIELTEGDDIAEQVRIQVETDPELARELRDSARRELGARAIDVIRQEVTDEQAEVIEAETERQIALDRLDVEFALEGRLDLTRNDILKLLQEGDKLVLYFTDANGQDQTFTLKWCIDARGRRGWVFDSCSTRLFRKDKSEGITPYTDQFMHVAALNKDMTNGVTIPQMNILSTTHAFGYAYTPTPKKKADTRPVATLQVAPPRGFESVTIKGSDFRTKDLNFFNGTQQHMK